jgi:broad specificity phosphatase PhoE
MGLRAYFMVIDLLRHGETTAGKQFIGRSNVSLTEHGWQQMLASVTSQRYELIVTSPLQHCEEFARHYAAQTGVPCVTEQDFREYDFGDWEGKTADELWATHRAGVSAFWDDPHNHAPPNAELFQQFQQRIATAMQNHVQQFQGKNMLLIAHSGVIRQIFMSLMNKSWQQTMKIPVRHGEIKRIFTTVNGWRLQDDCTLCDYM